MSLDQLTLLEESLLCNFEDNLNISELPDYVQTLWRTDWEEALSNDLIKEILINHNNSEVLKNIIGSNKNQEEVFSIGIASLLCFVQANFTGPVLPNSIQNLLGHLTQNQVDWRSSLNVDGDEINVNVIWGELLLITKQIFDYSQLSNTNILSWWCLRFGMIYQHLLDDCSEILFSNLGEHLERLSDWNLGVRLKAKLFLEMGQIYLMYGKVNQSEEFLNRAKDLLGMTLELSGELGKRTAYQQKDIAQMFLLVRLSEEIERPRVIPGFLPRIIPLQDEVRLDQIKYQNAQTIPVLPATEQSAVLATVQHLQRSRPKDDLRAEESEAFITVLIQQQNIWAIQIIGLFLRCYLESHHKRTIERSLAQCELIIEHLKSDPPNATDRLGLVWSVCFPPSWKVEAHAAELLLNLGLVKASLDLYLKLQMWDEVIICYTIIQLRHKSAEVIQTQLELRPTVKLWCLLGDATDDVTCYEKAWELSDHKSSRAQRHWGQFLFGTKNYFEAIPHLQKSLEINSLQNLVWLRLGYAALEVEDWKLAAHAYRRYTSLEPGGFEAWNNLAKAYTKLGEKIRAHYALQEALKYCFDNWKIWDNFMVVSAATSHFWDVIRAYHHILDLKEKHLDVEVLSLLVRHIMVNDDSDESSGRLLAKSRELFGRLTSLYPNDSALWELYSDLSPSAEVKAQRLYRTYRGLVQDDWARNPEKCGRVLEICYRLGEASLESNSKSSLSTARLTLKAAVVAANKYSWEQHSNILESVDNLLQKIVNSCST